MCPGAPDDRAHQRRPLRRAAGRAAPRGAHVPQVDRRHGDQRRRRRAPASAIAAAVFTKVGDDPVRGLRPLGAGRDTFGVDTRFVGDRPGPAHAAGLRRARPARRPAHHLLPGAQGARPEHRARRRRRATSSASGAVLWVPAGAPVRRAQPHDGPRPAGAAGPARRTPCSTSTGGRSSGTPRPAPPRSSTGRSTQATMAIGNRAECEVAVGDVRPRRGRRPRCWPAASQAAHRQAGRRRRAGGHRRRAGGSRSPPYPVEVVCGLGAGDAFGGALCHGLLSGWDIVRVRRATATPPARSSPARLMCADDMPTSDDIEDLIGERHAAGR